jgi:antitoxin (DNA-binding transcriptional repressor) of toxin-antitoxin stability system
VEAARDVPRYHFNVMAKTVATDEYEAHPLALLEEVAQTQEEVVVLRDGKPLGRLVPMYRRPITLEELRSLGGRILGDIEEPMGEWDMMK